MLVLVLPPDAEATCGLVVRALAHPLAGPPDTSPGTAAVLGGPRGVPVGKVGGWEHAGHGVQAKSLLACLPCALLPGIAEPPIHLAPLQLSARQDSGWVGERRPLEALRPPGTADVLLCSREGRLLEGLVTNLFVVAAAPAGGGDAPSGANTIGGTSGISSGGEQRQADGANSTSSNTTSAAGFDPAALVVYTAGMGDGVVWGTARARVLQACRRLGLTVREEPPDPRARATWREAFLTNSLRLVQPLACIACDPANVWGLPPWQLRLPQAPGPVAAAVRAALDALQPAVRAADLGLYAPPADLAAPSV